MCEGESIWNYMERNEMEIKKELARACDSTEFSFSGIMELSITS